MNIDMDVNTSTFNEKRLDIYSLDTCNNRCNIKVQMS